MSEETTAANRNTPLRTVLWGNAAFTTISALVMVALAGPIARVAGVPTWVVAGVGLALVPFAGLVAFAASRHVVPTFAVRLISLADFVWVLAAVVVISTPGSLSAAGKTGLALISLAVLGFGILEWVGLGLTLSRRTPPSHRDDPAESIAF